MRLTCSELHSCILHGSPGRSHGTGETLGQAIEAPLESAPGGFTRFRPYVYEYNR